MPAARPSALVVLELAPVMSARHLATWLRRGFLLEPRAAARALISPPRTTPAGAPASPAKRGVAPFGFPTP